MVQMSFTVSLVLAELQTLLETLLDFAGLTPGLQPESGRKLLCFFLLTHITTALSCRCLPNCTWAFAGTLVCRGLYEFSSPHETPHCIQLFPLGHRYVSNAVKDGPLALYL